MVISIVGSSVVAILSAFTIPPAVIPCVSGLTIASSALSIRFNLQDRKNKLNDNIQKLNRIKDKLEYIISCNGDLSEEECNNILSQFRIL